MRNGIDAVGRCHLGQQTLGEHFKLVPLTFLGKAFRLHTETELVEIIVRMINVFAHFVDEAAG